MPTLYVFVNYIFIFLIDLGKIHLLHSSSLAL